MKFPTAPFLNLWMLFAVVAVCLAFPATAANTSSSDAAKSAGGYSNRSSDKGSDSGGDSAKVWEYLNNSKVNPETGDYSPLLSQGTGGKQFQSAQQLWVAGINPKGGLTDIRTDATVEAACNGKDTNMGKTPACTERDATKKACDAAGKIFGIPSIYLVCAYSVSTKNIDRPKVSTESKENETDKTNDAKREESESENIKKANKKFVNLVGGAKTSKNEKDDPEAELNKIKDPAGCRASAEKARRLLNKHEEAIVKSNFLKGDNANCDYFRTLELLVASDRISPEFGNQMIQKGNFGIEEKPEAKPYYEALMKCMNDAAASLKAHPYDPKTCLQNKQQ